MECVEGVIAGVIVGVIFSFLFGLAVGMLVAHRTIIRFLTEDPDGSGGWNNRLEQLGQRFPGSHIHDVPLVEKEKGKK